MKKIKIILAISMVFIVFFTTITVYSSELPKKFKNLKEDQLKIYFEFAKESVEAYYLATMSQEEIKSESEEVIPAIDEQFTSNTIKSYVESKIDFETMYMNEFEYTKTYIDGEYNILSWEVIDDNFLLCNIEACIVFQYSDFYMRSSIMDEVQILIENPENPKVADLYVNEAYYDMSIRGNELDLSKKENWLSKHDSVKLKEKEDELLTSQKKSVKNQKKQINELKVNKNDVHENSENATSVITPTGSTSTRRQNAVKYAINNCQKDQPASGNGTVPFVYISPGCTVFISHCLLAGGYKTVGNADNSACWYFIKNGNPGPGTRSSSWAGVKNLYDFLVEPTRKANDGGPKAVGVAQDAHHPYNYDCPLQPCNEHKFVSPGDIIQIKYVKKDGSPDPYGWPDYGHSTMVTGLTSMVSGMQDILITWRTSAGQRGNSNVKLAEAYPLSDGPGLGGHLYRKIRLDY